MVVVVLTDCPSKLRGDLSKWLFEINTGVYVGNISARVRELLWKRICENVKKGQATMVYSAQGEEKLEFCVHNTSWKIVDYDGLKLMQRPISKQRCSDQEEKNPFYTEGFSKAAKYEKSRQIQIAKRRMMQNPREYVVVDIETTGLSHLSDGIIEVGALRILDGKPVEEYQSLVHSSHNIPESVKKLTGITDEDITSYGRRLNEVLAELLNFISDKLLVCHNAAFDISFIQAACKKEHLPIPKNKCIDTYIQAKRKMKWIQDYKLQTIAKELSVDTTGTHRALRDCYITYGIFTKLNEM